MTAEITPRQRAVYRAIALHIEACGYPPSIKDLCEQLTLTPATIWVHIAALQRKGYVERVPGVARGLRVIRSLDA